MENEVIMDKAETPKHHKHCHDCGRFVVRERWVSVDHPWKKHALCADCASLYDSPFDS